MGINRSERSRQKRGSQAKIPAGDNVCYILITCKEPSEKGEMQIEMDYSGEPFLISYLLESAQGMMDGVLENEECDAALEDNRKISSIV